MADLLRIKRNVAKMAQMNAPEQDIDGYINSEGVSVENVRNYQASDSLDNTPKTATEQIGENFLDNLKDIGYGAKKTLDGLTLGATDWLGRKTGVNEEGILKSKDKKGLRGLAEGLGTASEFAGNVMGPGKGIVGALSNKGLKGAKLAASAGAIEGTALGATVLIVLMKLYKKCLLVVELGRRGVVADKVLLPLVKTAGKVVEPSIKEVTKLINSGKVKLAKNNLKKQLSRGDEFRDVKFGKIDNSRLSDINDLRNLEDVAIIENGHVVVPAETVKHLYNKRIVSDGYDPKDVADVLNLQYMGKEVLLPSEYPTLQGLINPQKDVANVGIVGKHRDNKGVFVKTGYKKSIRDVNENNFPDAVTLDGRRSPSYGSVENSTPATRLSERQGISDNVSNSTNKVNSLSQLLSDKESFRALKSGVRASDEVAERLFSEAQNSASALNEEAGRISYKGFI